VRPFHLSYYTVVCYVKSFRRYGVHWCQVSVVLDKFVAYDYDCVDIHMNNFLDSLEVGWIVNLVAEI